VPPDGCRRAVPGAIITQVPGMYTTCIFCHHDLGRNDVVESFPIGRRLAFDPARGRLWAVCLACLRWNLSPIEERWEAVEACERTFRDATLRASSGEIALARLREGLDLIRIGKPLRPEFAGWRYGPRLLARRHAAVRRNLAVGLGGMGVGAATATMIGVTAATFGLTIALAGGACHLAGQQFVSWRVRQRREERNARTLGRLRADGGQPVLLQGWDGARAQLVPSDGPDGWAVRLWRDDPVDLTGGEAVRALGLLTAVTNDEGGTRTEITRAVGAIEEAGDAARFFRAAVPWMRQVGFGDRSLGDLPPATRLAIEIAAHEDFERAALEVDLKLLARAWREAEEIAAIADGLLLPEGVEDTLERWRPDADGPRFGGDG
jgi:hypothetical protein